MPSKENTIGIHDPHTGRLSSLGSVQARILRALWEAGVPCSATELFHTIYQESVEAQEAFPAATTIAATLSRMASAGFLQTGRRDNGEGPLLYSPRQGQRPVVLAVLNHAYKALVGKPIPPGIANEIVGDIPCK